MNIKYVEKAVDIIFENYNHDARIIELFQNFKISLDKNLIIDQQLKAKAERIVSELSKYFNLP